MPKKRVGVSLRKPSAPERAPKSAEVPAASDVSVAATVAPAEAVLRDTVVLDAAQTTSSDAAPIDTLQVVALQSEIAPSVIAPPEIAPSVIAPVEMAPSDAPAPLAAAMLASAPAASPVEKTIEAFVLGAVAASEQPKSEAPVEKVQDMLRRGPDGYRELTVYLPEDLAEALTVHCKENALDLSKLIASAVEHHLNAARAAVSAAPAAIESVLAVAARSLLGDLKGWVRSVLATRRRGWRTPATTPA